MIPDGVSAHAQLLQEPWCFTPDRIAGLTLWQIENLYLRPAHERNRSDDLRQKGADVSIDDDDMESFIAGLSAFWPEQPREKWEADWHVLQAEKRANDGR